MPFTKRSKPQYDKSKQELPQVIACVCGTENKAGANFCRACGNKLRMETSPQVEQCIPIDPPQTRSWPKNHLSKFGMSPSHSTPYPPINSTKGKTEIEIFNNRIYFSWTLHLPWLLIFSRHPLHPLSARIQQEQGAPGHARGAEAPAGRGSGRLADLAKKEGAQAENVKAAEKRLETAKTEKERKQAEQALKQKQAKQADMTQPPQQAAPPQAPARAPGGRPGGDAGGPRAGGPAPGHPQRGAAQLPAASQRNADLKLQVRVFVGTRAAPSRPR